MFDREKGMLAIIPAERDCFNYRVDDPDRCSADRCLLYAWKLLGSCRLGRRGATDSKDTETG
jgi:hypothetical protein